MIPTLYVLLVVLAGQAVGGGDIVTDGMFKSTQSSGAPLEVASNDMVLNLNADMVDGVEGAEIYTKAEVDALLAAIAVDIEPRKYYLKNTGVYGDQALTACASGFHMANVYELIDPSQLRYAYDHVDAYTRSDSGTGPPTANEGWVRTGSGSFTAVVGSANCSVWSTTGVLTGGTTVMLSPTLIDPTVGGTYYQVPGSVWYAYVRACDTTQKVWCVED